MPPAPGPAPFANDSVFILITAYTPLIVIVLNAIVMLLGIGMLAFERLLVWPITDRYLGLVAVQSLPFVLALDFVVFIIAPFFATRGIIPQQQIGFIVRDTQLVIGLVVPILILAGSANQAYLLHQGIKRQIGLFIKMGVIFVMVSIIGIGVGFSIVFDQVSLLFAGDPQQLEFIRESIGDTVFPVLVVILVLQVVATLVAIRSITAPLRRLTALAERAAEGDYRPLDTVEGGLGDEVTRLTDSINQMIEKVAGREKKLKQEIATLRIEVDEQKREAQVEAITSSDFFVDLQDKAEEMRQRRRRNEENEGE